MKKKGGWNVGYWGCWWAMVLAGISLSSAEAVGEDIEIADKTLLVWVSPANLSQKGGSVLTIEKPGGVFDGIVFGERATAKWMPGSNGFSRTQKEQGDFPAETVDAQTLVQIAIVYKERQITMYRNGKKTADYTAGNAETFGPDSLILLGLRHRDAGANNRFFAGAIDDARIYNVALDEKTIAALKPNEISDPKPLAWWSFEDGSVSDRMKVFPVSTLYGNARVSDGKLYLDGNNTYLMAVPPGKAVGRQLKSNDIARELREKLLRDPYRPGYHFVIPEGVGMPFDPNGAIYWKGRYHLFYIFQDARTGKNDHHFGHISSTDLFHWRFHEPGLVSGMFSGNCFVNKDGVPTMCYHQVGQGNALAVALDDDLNKWKKLDSNPITPKTKEGDEHHGKYSSWDPFGFIDNDTYYAIFGGKRPGIAKCSTLGGDWQYCGDLFAHEVEGVSINEDVSCSELFRLGNKDMILCISHQLGCRYYLGEWKDEQFYPEFHEKMSWVDHSFFAPESLEDDKGRRIMWAWVFDKPGFGTRKISGWSGTMSLPRVLSLGEDDRLRMDVPKEIENLRYNPKVKKNITIKADTEHRVTGIVGNSIELAIEMTTESAQQFGVKVCCSPDGSEETLVYYDSPDKKLKIDTTKSSLKEGPRSIEAGPFELKEREPLKLRVFVDKSVVEVFANGRQAVMRRIYPTQADSVNMVLFSKGGQVKVESLQAWDIMPSNPY
ncbi:MAG: GH32 C-terminal domain-containing protein [Sedimentisphaerales bacterium]|nr:GH32 C-terminal domain-containing protein [Sedimentisphaerales bacterium]